MPCTIPETSWCAGLGNVNHLHGKFIPGTCGPKYEQKHAFWVTEGKRQGRWLLSQKSPARSFLDPFFYGELEFQRVRSSKCDPLYDMSVKRPKRAILGRLTYKFQYVFVNCWRVVVLGCLPGIYSRDLPQKITTIETPWAISKSKRVAEIDQKHDFGPIEAHIYMWRFGNC